jgi:hypothetical protein
MADFVVPKGHVPVYGPEGELGHLPAEQLEGALQNGYDEATPEDVANHNLQQKYGSTGQEIAAGLEGAASAATFGLSTGLETAMGVPAEDIRGRREANPTVHPIGQAGGLAASILSGGRGLGLAAKVLDTAGSGVAARLGLGGVEAGVASRIGHTAVKQAVEMAMFQAGDEVSKHLMADPEQSLGTAVANVGLAGALGGVFGGAVSAGGEALWKATEGAKLGSFLDAVKNKMNGVAGTEAIDKMASEAGITLPPELRATLSGEKAATSIAQQLRESATGAGKQVQEGIDSLVKDAHESIYQALGKTPEEVAAQDVSTYEAGGRMKQALLGNLKEASSNFESQFAPIEEKFAAHALPETFHTDLSEKLAKIGVDSSYALREASPEMLELNRVIGDVKNLKTLENLRNFQSQVRTDLGNKKLFGLRGQVMGVLRDAETSALDTVLGKEAPELVAGLRNARQGYSGVMSQVEQLNDALHVGKFKGLDGFIKNLAEMDEEKVLRRLAQPDNVNLMSFLSSKYPPVADTVRAYHLDSLLSKASKAAGAQHGLNSRVFFEHLGKKMSPELKRFVLPEGAQARLDAAQGLLERIPKRINPAGTARTLDAIWKHMPGGVMGMLGSMMGHNPVAGFVLGSIGRYVGREVPDAAKLSLLKFLGTEGAADVGAFKAMHGLIEHMYQGRKIMDGAVKGIFRGAEDTLPEKVLPTQEHRDKLDKFVKVASTNMQGMEGLGGKYATYLPDHSVAVGALTGRVVSFLSSVKPDTSAPGPLEPDRVPTAMEKARYNTALDIAQQPLVVLKGVKDGSLTPFHIQALDAMYPALYRGLKVQAMEELASTKHGGDTIPYKTRLGLSMFLGMPLESSISPANVLANQTPTPPLGSPPQQGSKPPQSAYKGLSRLASGNQSSSQTREQDRQKA